MLGIELATRRRALGLSQGRLAEVLGVKQVSVSRWESGARMVPDGIGQGLAALEEVRDSMVDQMVAALEAAPGMVLIVHESDETWRRAHPGEEGVPFEVQQVAAGLAAALVDVRPEMVPWGMPGR